MRLNISFIPRVERMMIRDRIRLLKDKVFSLWPSSKQAGENDCRYIRPAEGDERLPSCVHEAEIASVNRRRKSYGLAPVSPIGSSGPDVRQNLTGLAISGGGIRSATFNLGVIQALARRGLLPCLDYLSTVSGGGYIGGCLSSIFATQPSEEGLTYRISGLPPASRLEGGREDDDGGWTIDGSAGDKAALVLPCAPGSQTVHLTATALDDKGQERPALVQVVKPLPEGVSIAMEQGAKGQILTVSVNAETSQKGITLPLVVVPDAFPFRHRVGQPEGPEFRHLRDSSNYLTPRKFLANLRLPALFLRGLLVNFLILLPLLLLASLMTVWVDGGAMRETLLTEQRTVTLNSDASWLKPGDGGPNRYDLHLDVLMAGSVPLTERFDYLSIQGLGRDVWPVDRDLSAQSTLVVPSSASVLPLVIAASGPPPTLTIHAWQQAEGAAKEAVRDPVVAMQDDVFNTVRWGVVAALTLLAVFPMVQGLWDGGIGSRWGTRDWLTRYVAGGSLLVVAVTTFVLIQPLVINGVHELGKVRIPGIGDGAEALTLGVAVLLAVGVLFSGPLASGASGLAGRVGLLLLGAVGPLVVWLVYLNLSRWILVPETAPSWLSNLSDLVASFSVLAGATDVVGRWLAWPLGFLHDGWTWGKGTQDLAVVYGGTALFALVVTRLFYDINATSFHGFYRDRLSKAYLMRPTASGTGAAPAHNDKQTLSGLSETLAPYHLINTTLNVPTSRRANLRGRNGTFFMMSRNFVGSQLTGYRATEEMEALHPDLDLGTSVAISGAAAAPNMGSETRRSLTFVLTLLNIRLGYWLPHPRLFSAPVFSMAGVGAVLRTVLRPFVRVTPSYLLKELMGRLDENGLHINLTDGGHLENLGLYELLRRRCRLIIACDGEADPEMTFQGLANAIRLARIDLGVNIEIDVDRLRACSDAGEGSDWSAAHGAVGRINYGDGEYGWLLYIKSSMTGDEPVSIRKYRDDDPSFPHQTTADQFFDEAQFEAYRALGYHAGEAVFDDVLGKGSSGQGTGVQGTGVQGTGGVVEDVIAGLKARQVAT